MRNKDIILLSKILKYIKELHSFINGYTDKEFQNDRKTINACVFNLSQIGELVSKISDELIEENPEVEWRGLKALRNRIVHDYDGVNLTMVWGFLTEELDELEEQIESIIENNER